MRTGRLLAPGASSADPRPRDLARAQPELDPSSARAPSELRFGRPARQLLIYLLTEFFAPKAAYLGIVAAKHVFFVKIRGKERPREPFQLEKNVTSLIYLQSLLWLLQPMYPFASVLGPVLLWFHFPLAIHGQAMVPQGEPRIGI